MRIIGGIYKGRKLMEFKGESVRPTSDMARESLFNILRFDVEGATFLDAFSGTGAVGMEALSRNAKRVVFNDVSKDSVTLIKKNLSLIGNPSNAEVYSGDAISLMNRREGEFDIIFLDPPYGADIKKQCLQSARVSLKEGGIVVLEDEKFFEEDVEGLTFYDKRKYGRVHFSFFSKGE